MLRSLLAERTRHQRQYKRRVNKRQMQTQESEIDTGKALDVDLVDSKPETLGQTQQFKDDNSKDNSILSNLKSLMKSFAVTTTDASNKRQQQPDSTSSTSTLATSVTADGNFDL
ncbi:hypothetical protein Tco_0105608 [Tanacetum coccineum]